MWNASCSWVMHMKMVDVCHWVIVWIGMSMGMHVCLYVCMYWSKRQLILNAFLNPLKDSESASQNEGAKILSLHPKMKGQRFWVCIPKRRGSSPTDDGTRFTKTLVTLKNKIHVKNALVKIASHSASLWHSCRTWVSYINLPDVRMSCWTI
jgi:hypothetical protein